jgi:hypothetical protein
LVDVEMIELQNIFKLLLLYLNTEVDMVFHIQNVAASMSGGTAAIAEPSSLAGSDHGV